MNQRHAEYWKNGRVFAQPLDLQMPEGGTADKLPGFALPEKLRRQNIANMQFWQRRGECSDVR
jgi:hypothetical protein